MSEGRSRIFLFADGIHAERICKGSVDASTIPSIGLIDALEHGRAFPPKELALILHGTNDRDECDQSSEQRARCALCYDERVQRRPWNRVAAPVPISTTGLTGKAEPADPRKPALSRSTNDGSRSGATVSPRLDDAEIRALGRTPAVHPRTSVAIGGFPSCIPTRNGAAGRTCRHIAAKPTIRQWESSLPASITANTTVREDSTAANRRSWQAAHQGFMRAT